MVVEPVDNNSEKVEESYFKRSESIKQQNLNNAGKAEQAKKEERKKIIPSLSYIVHNAINDFFETIKATADDVQNRISKSENRLSRIDPNKELEIFGKIYKKENIQDSLTEIVDKFDAEVAAGNNSEVLANLKKFSPELQLTILNSLLDKITTFDAGLTKYMEGLGHNSKLLDFMNLLKEDNSIVANFSKEQRTVLLEKISEKAMPSLVSMGVDVANAVQDIGKLVYGTISEKLQVVFDNTQEINTLVDKLAKAENFSEGDLKEIQEKAEKARLTIQHARIEVDKLRKMGEAEQATELENKIIVMEQAVSELTKVAEKAMENCTPEQKIAVQNVLNKVNELFQQRVTEIADYVRDQAKAGVRITLGAEAFNIVNKVLIAAGETPLERSLFCRNDTNLNIDAEIQQVITSNYDLSYQDDNLSNLQISTAFIYDTIFSVFRADLKERQQLNDQRLAEQRQTDAQEVKKFLDQYANLIKETQKRLDKIAFQKALTRFSLAINCYRDVVQEIIKTKGQDSPKLHWYKYLLETEQQKQIARTIFEINKSDNSFSIG